MKKILVIVTMILILTCFKTAYANDGGILKDDGKLTVKAKTTVESLELGDEFNFTLTLTNNTDAKIEQVTISNTFKNDDYYYPNFNNDYFIDIEPYKTITVECTSFVDEAVSWYKKYGKYYVDLESSVSFYYVDDNDWYTANQTNPIAIEITNINDGSDIYELNVLSEGFKCLYTEQMVINYVEHIDFNYEIKNITDKDITAVYESTNQEKINVLENNLESGDVFKIVYSEVTGINYAFDIPDEKDISFKTLAVVDGKYYANQYDFTCPTLYVAEPELEMDIKNTDDECEDGVCIVEVTVTNLGEGAVENILLCFFDGIYDINTTMSDRNILVEKLDGNGSTTFYAKIQYEELYDRLVSRVLMGYLCGDNKAYMWDDIYQKSYGSTEICATNYEGFYKLVDVPENVRLSHLSITDLSVEEEEVKGDNQQVENDETDEVSETTNTHKPQIIEVNEKKYIPVWVWFILAVSISVTIYYIIRFRKTRS